MLMGEPRAVPRIRNIVGPLVAVVVLIGMIDGTTALLDTVFPEPDSAESIPFDRMTICGRSGKYRVYCGVPDDFVGPLEDPRKQWNRKVP